MSDTLTIDTVRIAQWQSQPDFDYNRELVGDGTSVMEWLRMQLNELLRSIFGQAWNSDLTTFLLILLAIAALALVGWYVWRNHPGLFQRKSSLQAEEAETEDTIYGVDFEESISQALHSEDYREAIRLRYLQTLKALADGGQIDWQPFKTPMQYVQEIAGQSGNSAFPAKVAAFRALTSTFLRVRYGNFPATRELYDEVCDQRKEVTHEP